MGVVIVYHMKVSMSTSWHSLNKAFSKVIEGNSDLHVLVLSVGITVTQQHHLIMVGHVIVGYGDSRGPHYSINQAILAVRQGAVIHPHVAPTEDGHAVAVRYRPPPEVARGAPHHSIPSLLAVMNIYSVNNNICDILNGNARTTSNVHAGTPPVNSFEGIHDELFLQLDYHVTLKNNPQRLVLNDGVAEGSGFRGDRIVVAGVGDHIDFTVSSANGILAESNGAIG